MKKIVKKTDSGKIHIDSAKNKDRGEKRSKKNSEKNVDIGKSIKKNKGKKTLKKIDKEKITWRWWEKL